MKKILFGLLMCQIILGCSPERVPFDEVYRQGDLFYHNGAPFSGISFAIWPNARLKFESELKNGMLDGIEKSWYDNGVMRHLKNYKKGKLDGVQQLFYESNGQLREESVFEDGELIRSRFWHENGIEVVRTHYDK